MNPILKICGIRHLNWINDITLILPLNLNYNHAINVHHYVIQQAIREQSFRLPTQVQDIKTDKSF